MTIPTNTILLTINLLTLLTPLTNMGMEKKQYTQKSLMASLIPTGLITMATEKNIPQPQLKNPTKKTKVMNGTLSIVDEMVIYITPQFTQPEEEKIKVNQLPLHTEPFVQTHINAINTPTIGLYVPAQLLLNCDTNSWVTFPWTTTTHNTIVHAQCITTTKNSFQENFTKNMNRFYKQPQFLKHNQQALIDAGIITATTNQSDNTQEQIFYGHGPHGHPSEESFIKMIIAPHIKLYGDSMHNLIVTRQLSSKPIKRTLQHYTPEESQSLINRLKQLTITNK